MEKLVINGATGWVEYPPKPKVDDEAISSMLAVNGSREKEPEGEVESMISVNKTWEPEKEKKTGQNENVKVPKPEGASDEISDMIAINRTVEDQAK